MRKLLRDVATLDVLGFHPSWTVAERWKALAWVMALVGGFAYGIVWAIVVGIQTDREVRAHEEARQRAYWIRERARERRAIDTRIRTLVAPACLQGGDR